MLFEVMEDATPLPGTREAVKCPPLKGREEAVVRCKGFQCLAYRDKDGVWRSVANDEELPEVLAVVLRF
jgi:hypothetical protein